VTGGALWPDGPVALPALVRLGDETYRVRAMPTFDLLYAIGAGDWAALLPYGLGRRDRRALALRLYDPADGLDLVHLWQGSTALAGRLAGVSVDEGHDPQAAWWPAMRLAGFAVTHWLTFDGWCVRRGFDPHTAPLHRIIAAAWQYRIDTRPDDGAGEGKAKPISVEALRKQVWTPPAGHRSQTMKFTREQERASAMAALREILPG
jgi:hypothetical protein